MTTNQTAVAEHQAGRYDQAEALYRSMLEQSPTDLATLIGLGDVLTDAGKGDQALEFYRKAIELDPDSPANAGAYDGLAAVLQDSGDLDNAITASKKAAVLRGSAEDAYGVGLTLEYLGRLPDAIDMFKLATELKPEYYEAHAKAGMYLLTTGKAADAITHYQAAIQINPEVAELHCNLANAQRRLGENNLALNAARRAIEIKPTLPEAHNVMGAIWKDRRRWSDALTSLGKAVQLKPDAADALNNTGIVLKSIGRPNEATPYFEKAVKLRPDILEFHLNLAANLLSRGEFARGFDEFEWRRHDPRNPASRQLEKPLWSGWDLQGKTLLLHTETSLSRTIQFLRYLPLLKNTGARIVVECQNEILGLLKSVDSVAEVIVRGQPLPEFDAHLPLLSLAKVLNTTPQSIPASFRYLTAEASKVAAWTNKLITYPGRKIGLAWPESYNSTTDRDRVAPPEKLAKLTSLSNTHLFNLQKTTAPLPAGIVDLSADLTDLSETAALIANVDLIIGCDSPALHLAAALGKPTVALLPTDADWCWILDSESSPWYPAVKLLRRSADQSWTQTIDNAIAAVEM